MANVYPVTNFKDVNVTRYKEGDFFTAHKKIAVLIDGKLKTLSTQNVNLKDYIKRSELDQHLKETYPDVFKEKEGE